MVRQLIFLLLALFAVYVFVNDTATATETAKGFLDWLSDGIDSTREFVGVALGEDVDS